ncbi:TonB-dependent receptor [Novosphingobium sp. AAP1]|uniref:TonB-dependent receptor n=1 Tax=Novosphingobium sp. AAP1 TaxID=1523413 RepID=UPI0009E7A706|nr:TonB-dependent receptor [Novosphingobium sp. AAP1]
MLQIHGNFRAHAAASLGAMALALVGTNAFAQAATEAAPAPVPAQASPAPGEIVVTAQRRSESSQKVAIALTAVGGDQLTQKAVLVQRDLQNVAPGLTITKAGLTESINIRGIGLSSGSPQVANGVATYVDGLFQPPIAQSFDLYDIQSIEVLRGPQGTLVGSNSTGGAIFINSKRPKLGDLGGDVTAEYGSYNNVRLNGAINVPVGDNLALRFATNQHWRDSYYTDLGPYKNQPDSLKEHDERLSALYQSGGFTAYWKGELAQKSTGGYAYQPIAGTQFAAGRQATPYELNYDTKTANFERAFTTALELKYQTPGGLVVRSVSGYQNKRVWNVYDLDGTNLAQVAGPFGAQYEDQYVREKEYSQEINIISPDSKPLNFILGGYYQHNDIDVLLHYTGTAPFPIVVNPMNSKTTLGAFAQVNYRITEKLEIQAGARYSHYHVDGTGGVYLGGPPPSAFLTIPQTGTEADGRMTGKIALNYKPDADNMLYVFAARGYKPGGINPPGGMFNPETVWDFEAGWKSSFLDRHVRTQIGVFYNKYNNFQMDVISPASGQNGVVNLANATIKGFEGQLQAKLAGFGLDAGVSYVDSQLSSVTVINKWQPGAATAQLPACATGVTSNCFPYQFITSDAGPNLLSPKWTWNAGLDYTYSLGEGRSIVPRVNYSYIGSQWAYVTYLPQFDLINARHLVNASVTLNWDNFKVELYGTNLTKEYFVTGQSGLNEFRTAPREFGVRLGAKF